MRSCQWQYTGNGNSETLIFKKNLQLMNNKFQNIMLGTELEEIR